MTNASPIGALERLKTLDRKYYNGDLSRDRYKALRAGLISEAREQLRARARTAKAAFGLPRKAKPRRIDAAQIAEDLRVLRLIGKLQQFMVFPNF